MQETSRRRPQMEEISTGSWTLLGATLAVALLSLLAQAMLGTPPAGSDTGQQVVAWFREHRDAARWLVWSMTVSTLPFAAMIALLRRLLPAPHRDVFLIGGIAILVVDAAQSWFWAGLALHADQLEPAIARTLLDVAVFYGPVLTGATTTMFAPVTLLALQGRSGFPLWLGVLGAVAFVEQAIETITIFGSTGFTQPGGAMNLQLGAALTLAWVLAFGVWGGLKGQFQPATA